MWYTLHYLGTVEYKPRRPLTLVEVEKRGQTNLSLYCSGRQLYNLKALKLKLLSKILPFESNFRFTALMLKTVSMR